MNRSPVVISASRGKALKLLFFSAVLAAFSGLALHEPHSARWAPIGLVFFGLLALRNLVALVVPPRLVIDERGLHWRGLRAWHLDWSQIARFRFVALRFSSSVVIDYRDEARSSVWRRLLRPKAIPSIVWMRPQELQELLQERLDGSEGRSPEPLLAAADASIPQPVTVVPWLSLGLLVALALVFTAEIRFPVSPASAPLQPSVMTLAAFGGPGRHLLTGPGQWYRFVLAPFLHINLAHLVGNGVALLLAGRLLEGVIGRAWFAGVYVVGALTGAAVSLAMNRAGTVSVGASGAILALFAAACVCSVHFARSAGRYRLQQGAIAILLPTLMSLGGTAGGVKVDFGDHLGGALGRALMGLVLLRGWGPQAARPPRQGVGAMIAGLGALACIAAIGPALSAHRLFERTALLVPIDVMPKDDEGVIAQASSLLVRYPSDPRLHLAAAIAAMRKGDGPGAEREAQEGLRRLAPVHALFNSRVEASLWMVLGEALASRNADDEARAAYDRAGALDAVTGGLDFDRARLDFETGNLDRALSEATRLTQNASSSPDAWQLLGDIHFSQTDLSAAMAAYDKAEGLKPSAASETSRGLVRFYTGDRAGALADLEAAMRSDPSFPYRSLWITLARLRQGEAPGEVDETLTGAEAAWPAPVFRLFLGKEDPAAVLAAAQADTSQAGKGRLCEAGFYIAEWDLLHDRPAEATSGFRKAAQDCPPFFVETWMARAELKQGSDVAR